MVYRKIEKPYIDFLFAVAKFFAEMVNSLIFPMKILVGVVLIGEQTIFAAQFLVLIFEP